MKETTPQELSIAEKIYEELGSGYGFNGNKEDAIKIIEGYLNTIRLSPELVEYMEGLMDRDLRECKRAMQIATSELTMQNWMRHVSKTEQLIKEFNQLKGGK